MVEPNASNDTMCVVLCTCPDKKTANQVATKLVGEGLAACVNRLAGVESIYRWEGKVEKDKEELLVIKTRAARYPALEARIRELHPYDVPEVIALPIERGARDYLAWIAESVE